jgi:hypothetical protein
VLCTWRYYDPLTGRFLTRDPIGYAGGLNLYAFAGNNPVSYADPSGTNPLLCGGIGAGLGAIIGGGVAYVHHQDVLQAVVHGAVVGGVTGFFTCLGAPELGAGFLGSAASGAVGGAIGDTYGQATAIAFGWQDCFNWPELLSSAAFGGAVGGLTNVLGGAGGAVPEGSGCFTAGTPLVMADGTTRPIEQIKQDDRVLAKDPVSGTVAAKLVTRTFVREVNETLALTFADGQQIETTANHPFYVEGQGFVPAGTVGIGTLIVTRAGPAVKLVMSERKVGRTQVYNLEVEGFHSYFVGRGEGAVWVHNAPCAPGGTTPVFDQQAVDHIALRHWPTSEAAGAGKFNPDITLRGLRDMINEAVNSGTVRPNTMGRPGQLFEHDFGSQVGIDINGNAATRLRVVVSNGRVVTAFPY